MRPTLGPFPLPLDDDCMFTPDGVACCYNKLVRGVAHTDRYCRTKGMESMASWMCRPSNRTRCCAVKGALDTDRLDPLCDPSAPRPPPPPPRRPVPAPPPPWMQAPCWTTNNGLAQCCRKKTVFDGDCTPQGEVVPCARAPDGLANCCERRRRTNNVNADPSCVAQRPTRCYTQRGKLTPCCKANPRDPDCTPAGNVLECSLAPDGREQCCARRRTHDNAGLDPGCTILPTDMCAYRPATMNMPDLAACCRSKAAAGTLDIDCINGQVRPCLTSDCCARRGRLGDACTALGPV